MSSVDMMRKREEGLDLLPTDRERILKVIEIYIKV